jgi:hypothetical protein
MRRDVEVFALCIAGTAIAVFAFLRALAASFR